MRDSLNQLQKLGRKGPKEKIKSITYNRRSSLEKEVSLLLSKNNQHKMINLCGISAMEGYLKVRINGRSFTLTQGESVIFQPVASSDDSNNCFIR